MKKSRIKRLFFTFKGFEERTSLTKREIIPKRGRLPFRYKHMIKHKFFFSMN